MQPSVRFVKRSRVQNAPIRTAHGCFAAKHGVDSKRNYCIVMEELLFPALRTKLLCGVGRGRFWNTPRNVLYENAEVVRQEE